LIASFSKKGVREAVFSSYADDAPGPDGMPFLFYQKIWDIIKDDMLALVRSFQENKLDLFRINFATITRIPKVEDATEIKNFRPISLLNRSFKIFGRLLTIRLEKNYERL
jgi:hypothetical protein